MTWLPGLVVLAVGLAAGFLAARKFGRRGGDVKEGAGKGRRADRDVELQLADLEARRDDLYRRLRDIDQGVAPAADRQALEKAAARTLLEIDRLAKKHPRAKHAKAKKQTAEPQGAPVSHSTTKVLLVGFSYGVGLAILVGALVYWAVRDAEPRPEMQAAPMSSPAPGPDQPHPQGALPSDVANRIASLDQFILSNPDDIEARKELGYVLLGAGRYVDAFGQGGQILARSPEDADGLYMQGVVRLTMGQADQAAALLDRAVVSDPSHVDALTALGVIRLRLGDYDSAIAHWKQGLAALGGSQPTLERMIASAEAGQSAEEVLGMPVPPASEPAAARAPSPAAAAQPSPGAITVNIELAPGAVVPPGAILFVSLSGPTSGPPAAARRIDSPTFPMTLALTQNDSMMGAPLPERGTVNVRLDADGSASTRSPEDLVASSEAGMGETVSLVLSR